MKLALTNIYVYTIKTNKQYQRERTVEVRNRKKNLEEGHERTMNQRERKVNFTNENIIFQNEYKKAKWRRYGI